MNYNDNIYIPKILKVGYNKRENTYTNKLAYVIYYDNKNILRKENSWNSWIDKSLGTNEYNNELLSGFVINKNIGGVNYGWNSRKSYIRIYDPRGFEIEISIENLLYILQYTNSIVGKGLEGNFIYGWSGKELVLIPEKSPDYLSIKEFSEKKKIIKY